MGTFENVTELSLSSGFTCSRGTQDWHGGLGVGGLGRKYEMYLALQAICRQSS